MSLFTFTCLPSKVSTKTADYLERPQRILKVVENTTQIGGGMFSSNSTIYTKSHFKQYKQAYNRRQQLGLPGGSTCELDETYASYLILAHSRHYAKT